MVRRLTAAFFASADRWGVGHRLALFASIGPLAGMLLLAALFFAWRGAFRLVLNEDGVAEYLQLACWVGIGIFAAAIAVSRWRSGHRWQALIFVGVALAAVFAAGEEISWGQRVLGFETPENLLEINVQGETTLHNIGRSLFAFNLLLVVTSLYAIAAEPLGRWLGVGRRWDQAEWLFLPPLFLAGAFVTEAGHRIGRALILTMDSYALTKLGEWSELSYAAGVLAFMFLAWRQRARLRRAATQPAAGSPLPQIDLM